MSKIVFPYYSGNIFDSYSLGFVDLDYFIETIRKPKPQIQELFNKIKQATIEEDWKLKRSLKHQLYSFTPSVIIEKDFNRSYKNVKNFTGLMQIDFDGMETIEEAKTLKEFVFKNQQEIVCAFLSPSGKGVKCLMRIEKPESVEHYKAMHKAMESEFEQYNYLDASTKNAVLPMFLSNDPLIMFRKYGDCKEWVKTDYSKPEYVRLNETPTTSNIDVADSDKNLRKVIRIIEKRFSDIINNGHPQVRSTALVLGSRVAAGYIDKVDAETLAKNCILNNSYLQKGLQGYLKTANWAINQGMKQPKYF